MWSGPRSYKCAEDCDDILRNSADIINNLMGTTTFLQNFKEAHVRPLLKKHLRTFLKKIAKKWQDCIQLEFHSQNVRKSSSQSVKSS